jgi:hypothetical protein
MVGSSRFPVLSRSARHLSPHSHTETTVREADLPGLRGLTADPTSATQAGFEAYDGHIGKATAYLRRSNEMLGRDYKTVEPAQE